MEEKEKKLTYNQFVEAVYDKSVKLIAKKANTTFRSAAKDSLLDLDIRMRQNVKEGFGGSGLSYLLDTIVQNLMLKSYREAPSVIREICYIDKTATSLTKEKDYYMLGDVMDMPQKTLKGAYTEIEPVSDSRVQAKPELYGFAVSFNATDSLDDVFNTQSRILAKMGKQAKAIEDKVGFTYFKAQDSAICTTANGNLTTNAISQSALEAGVIALAKQTNAKGQYLSVQPKFLLGGPSTMMTREKLVRNIYEVGSSDYAQTNILQGRFVPLTSPYFTGNEWYLMVAPDEIELFIMLLLQAFGGEPVASRKIPDTKVISGKGGGLLENSSFDNLSIQYKFDHAFNFKVSRTDGVGIYGKTS